MHRAIARPITNSSGTTVVRGTEGMTFTEDEVEIMAEIEHARWNVERLLDGWT